MLSNPEHRWMAVIPMTGPDRFHFHGVAAVLKRNGYALPLHEIYCIAPVSLSGCV